MACELACEASGCEVGCEVSCETGCQTSCESGCEPSCETGCESGCQVSCETGCETLCETGCEISCEVGCETSCETGLEVILPDKWYCCEIDYYYDNDCLYYSYTDYECKQGGSISETCYTEMEAGQKDIVLHGPYDTWSDCDTAPCPG